MEGAGKGNGKEAALGETLVSPYINPTSQSAYSVWLCHPHSVHFVGDRATLFRTSFI